MKRSVAIAVVFLAGCSSAVVTTTTPAETPPTSTSEVTTADLEATRAEIEAALAAIGPVSSLSQAAAVVEAIGAGTEPDLVPYLYDVARLSGSETFSLAMETMARITGEDLPDGGVRTQSLFFGNWIMNNAPDPGPAYVAWKAALFANIDAAFEPLLASVDDAVTASRLQWGGVLRGGIPELNDAETISVAEADYMIADELVFGAVVNGEARAYPVRILGHHELANDTLGGEPVSLVYCTLCRTPVFYSREVAGRVLDFETSGLLQNSNKVMVDVQTDSLWNQLTGEAFAGPLTGEVLQPLPMTVTTWGDWITQHPETDVQRVPTSSPAGAGYSYEPGDAYTDYYAAGELWFPSFQAPDAFAEMDEVVTLDYLGERLAVGVEELVGAGGLLAIVGDRPVVFVATARGARVYQAVDGLEVVDGAVIFADGPVTITEEALTLPDGTALPRLVSGQSFWFAWYGNFPDTNWWPL